MKIINYIFFALCIILFTACASASVEYKEVYIPTKCEIQYPILANKTDDVVENQRNLVIYTLELENALDCCVKGECE